MEETIGYEALLSAEEWAHLIDWKPDDPDQQHRVTVWYPPGELAGNETLHEIECDTCGHIGAADTLDEGQAQARLHEALGTQEMRQ